MEVCNWLNPPDLTGIFSDGAIAGEFSAARHIQDCLLGPSRRILRIAAHTFLCSEIRVKVSEEEVEVSVSHQGFNDGLKPSWLGCAEAIAAEGFHNFADTG